MLRTTTVALIALAPFLAGLDRMEDHRFAAAESAATPSPGEKTRVVRWIVVGGGPEPVSTEVSLEQDVALARDVLGDGGLTLFAGGRGAAGVRVLQPRGHLTSLFGHVADLLDPRQGRDSTYRAPRIEVDGAATREATLAAIEESVRRSGRPLLAYFATHGEKGETARHNGVHLWGNSLLTVGELAETLEAEGATRQVRLVVTSCYSGGFADLAFAAGDSERGRPAPTARCGLFASEWDELSSGCDPNPDRRAQEGYGIHFLNALRGRDRSGRPLAPGDVDFDGDGTISLLEAHARTRIASRSMGVPTSTSERWLRHAAPKSGARSPFPVPEEEAVINGLSRRLRLADERTARRRLAKLEKKLAEVDDRLTEVEDEEVERHERLRIAMLGRWPVLDDPWHPAFRMTFRGNRRAIRGFLRRSPVATNYREARREADRWQVYFDRLRLRTSDVRRLVRAYDNVDLASRLHAAGGPAWEHYERLLACERGVP